MGEIVDSLKPRTVLDFYAVEYMKNFSNDHYSRWARVKILDLKDMIWRGFITDLTFPVINETVWSLTLLFDPPLGTPHEVPGLSRKKKNEYRDVYKNFRSIKRKLGGFDNMHVPSNYDCVRNSIKECVAGGMDYVIDSICDLRTSGVYHGGWNDAIEIYVDLFQKGWNKITSIMIDKTINSVHRTKTRIVNDYFPFGKEVMNAFEIKSISNNPIEYVNRLSPYVRKRLLRLFHLNELPYFSVELQQKFRSVQIWNIQ